MNTPSNYELKQIAEKFFKETGTFCIDNVLGLMKKAYESGYAKGNLDGKFQNSVPPIKTVSASDLKAAMDLKSVSNPWNQWQCNSVVPNADKLPGLNKEPLAALNLKDLKFPEPCKEWMYPFYT